MSVRVNDLAKAVTDTMEEYQRYVTEGMKKAQVKAARQLVQDIKEKSPVLTGDYQKGWTRSVDYESATEMRIIVHNETDYQLTHLLENGHAKVDGGRVAAIPHIQPAAEKMEENLMQALTVVVKG